MSGLRMPSATSNWPLFHAAPSFVLQIVAGIGAFTALLAALIALTQTDLKRVLAYSTMSQLGYMFLALGSGAVVAAIFHLFTHAFFKALLFLAAGSVMHAMGNVIDMRRFSGLRHVLKITHMTFLCGAGALAGVPLLSSASAAVDLEPGQQGQVIAVFLQEPPQRGRVAGPGQSQEPRQVGWLGAVHRRAPYR